MAAALAGCGPSGGGVAPAGRTASSPEGSYLAPPALESAQHFASGRILLVGRAPPTAHVRLASPQGQALFATSDRAGAWRLSLPASPETRLFGLSVIDASRPLQAQGYQAVTPGGTVAELRAGAGARVLDAGGRRPRILALDFDRKGGAVISGFATAGSALGVRIDGVARGSARAGPDGRFTLAFDEPLAPGPHRFEVVTAGGTSGVDAVVSAAGALTTGPFSAARAGEAWRIDWTTPGGGMQSTLLFDGSGA